MPAQQNRPGAEREGSRHRIQGMEAPTGGEVESPSRSESPLGKSRCCSPVTTWQAGFSDTSHPWAYSEKSQENQAHLWTFEDVKLPGSTTLTSSHSAHPRPRIHAETSSPGRN